MSTPAHDPRPVVIVSEDETLVRMFTADFLDEAGFRVFEAINADEALALLQALPAGARLLPSLPSGFGQQCS